MTACVQTAAPCELLPWDSDFFRFRIGRVHGDTLDDNQAEEIEEWALTENVRCLYFLARADCPATIRNAERFGFNLVDIRVTLQRDIRVPQDLVRPQPASDFVIRPFRVEDVPALEAIAEKCHLDTRFFSDRQFPRARATAFYSTWIRLECQGRAQQVLVAATAKGEALGYVSCHLHSANSCGQIGLIGVSSEARGKGIGKGLVFSALNWFEAQQMSQVTVVTQGRNVTAQRLYQSCGFLTRDVRLWYHKWYASSRSDNG